MAHVTLQLIEGLERGQVCRDLPTPVTMGREDENSIRLNDERVSRFHAKIQEDGGRVILTDLESTNGTRVNGHPVQMRVLQVGDQIAIGRCLLVFGSPEEISARTATLLNDRRTSTDVEGQTSRGRGPHDHRTPTGGTSKPADVFNGFEDECLELFPDGPPDPPHGLRPLQRAQVSDLLGYSHEQIRRVIHSAVEEEAVDGRVMRVSWEVWQRLLRLEMELAVAMRKVTEPDA